MSGNQETLENTYRLYISYLNDRKTHELSRFVHTTLTYNGKQISLTEYQDMIAEDQERVPDLYFNVLLLVANDNHVSARIMFDCTPTKEFFGHHPNGKKISFAEHVFYRFEDGKIKEVWSLIDKAGVAAQMTGKA